MPTHLLMVMRWTFAYIMHCDGEYFVPSGPRVFEEYTMDLFLTVLSPVAAIVIVLACVYLNNFVPYKENGRKPGNRVTGVIKNPLEDLQKEKRAAVLLEHPHQLPNGDSAKFELVSTNRDGHCFFHAIAKVYKGLNPHFLKGGVEARSHMSDLINGDPPTYKTVQDLPGYEGLGEGPRTVLKADWFSLRDRLSSANNDSLSVAMAQEAEVFLFAAIERVNVCIFVIFENPSSGIWQCSMDPDFVKQNRRIKHLYIMHSRQHFEGLLEVKRPVRFDRMHRRAAMAGGENRMRTC